MIDNKFSALHEGAARIICTRFRQIPFSGFAMVVLL